MVNLAEAYGTSTATGTGDIKADGTVPFTAHYEFGGYNLTQLAGTYVGGTTLMGHATRQGILQIHNANGLGIEGRDSETDDSSKVFRIGCTHYDNEDEPVGMMIGQSTSSDNKIWIGGGSSWVNAITEGYLLAASRLLFPHL